MHKLGFLRYIIGYNLSFDRLNSCVIFSLCINCLMTGKHMNFRLDPFKLLLFLTITGRCLHNVSTIINQ